MVQQGEAERSSVRYCLVLVVLAISLRLDSSKNAMSIFKSGFL